MSKIKVGVLRGGPSSEYDVSLKTGSSVLKHLPAEKYQPVDILISKDGVWHAYGEPISPYNLKAKVDVVFNALHGSYGEDGQVQKLLDSIYMPYTGSGHLGSAIGMNKIHSKEYFRNGGLKVARHFVVSSKDDFEAGAGDIFQRMSPPWIVKPADGGSSLGCSLARNYNELVQAINLASQYSNSILVEEFIKGREATCGVVEGLRGQKIYSLLPVEILKPKDKTFFDYEAKYTGISQEICPGNFTPEEKEELGLLAARVHEILNLRHYSRTDFILSPRGIYVLEVNTLPGLTNESLLPKSLSAVGVAYSDFLDHIITLALNHR